jgi:hypothetical protein
MSWLSGYWLNCDDGRQLTETWSMPRDGLMVGVNQSSGDGEAAFEFLRIATAPAGASYFAMPGGGAATEFPLAPAASGEMRAVFENPAHDFPQRIVYSREGQTLTARIEGAMDGKTEGMEWTFTAATLNTACPA